MILWRPVLHGSSLFSFWFRGNSSTGIIKSCLISHPVEELQMHLFIFCDSSGSGQGEERAWWRCWQQWQGELCSPNCTGRAEVWFLASQSAFPLVPCFECWVQLVGLHLYFQCIWVQPYGREAQCLGRGKLREPRSFLINHQREVIQTEDVTQEWHWCGKTIKAVSFWSVCLKRWHSSKIITYLLKNCIPTSEAISSLIGGH